MERELIIYSVYMLFFMLLVGTIILVPLLSFSQDMGAFYKLFAPTCHQKISRSLCVFSDGSSSYWLGDCTAQGDGYVFDQSDREQVRVVSGSVTGYKMPVCARDLGIYGALLFGGLLYPLVRDIKDKSVWPAIFLILAMVPIGLDGGIQLVSELGFLPFVYESTNAMRLATGAISGFVAAFYAIPILVNMFCGSTSGAPKKTQKQNEAKPETTNSKPAKSNQGND